MTEETTVAERMYPDLAPAPPRLEQAEPAANNLPEDDHEDDAEPTEAAVEQVSVDELVNREQSVADRWFSEAGPVPDDPAHYGPKLDEGFKPLEVMALLAREHDEVLAINQARRDTTALLHELQVPLGEAGEFARSLSEWHRRDAQSEDDLLVSKGRAIDALEKEWGREADARFELAQRTACEACERLPWLADLFASGAGNDPVLIRKFAEIGLRKARRKS